MTDLSAPDPGPWLPEGVAPAPAPQLCESSSGSLFAAGFRSARRAVVSGGQWLLDVVYPPSCISCHGAAGEPDALCAACWSRMRLIEKPYCQRLGTPFAMELGEGLISPQAFADPPVYERARAVARFEDGPARDLVHRLKYGDRLELARPMGLWMARAGAELLCDADLIVPVPLHRRRLFSRRFNQAATLAQAISNRSGVAWDGHILERVKATQPQVGKTRAQRADNVQGAFRVRAGSGQAIAGKRILLVDDVLTSGATANAASRRLLRAGAVAVDVLIFARVVHDS